MRPEPAESVRPLQRRVNQCSTEASPARVWGHHQLSHHRRQVQISVDFAIVARSHQMLCAPLDQLTQNLFTDRRHSVEFGCLIDDLTYSLLLRLRQLGAPVDTTHLVCSCSTSGVGVSSGPSP